MMWLWVFLATVIADYFWAEWSSACAKERPVPAAVHSALIILCGGFTIMEYTNNHWLLIPAMLGAAFGTYASIKSKSLATEDRAHVR